MEFMPTQVYHRNCTIWMNKDNERFKRRADEEGMAMVQERRESSTWNGPNEVGNESVHNVHETS